MNIFQSRGTYLLTCLLTTIHLFGGQPQTVTIEPYVYTRDISAVRQILTEYPQLQIERHEHEAQHQHGIFRIPAIYEKMVVRMDTTTVGIIGYHIYPGNELRLTSDTILCNGTAYIDFIGILPEYQRSGYAKQLLSNALSRCSQHAIAQVHATIEYWNRPAHKLFTNAGFKTGNNTRYYAESAQYTLELARQMTTLDRIHCGALSLKAKLMRLLHIITA